ncbi:hypothetical protein Goarm_009292, partial [Gossypium armourianum]|nr:hypothetical protein [Gossypium armourianum]
SYLESSHAPVKNGLEVFDLKEDDWILELAADKYLSEVKTLIWKTLQL